LKILKAIGLLLGTAACLSYLGCGTTEVATLAGPSISTVLPQTIAAGSSTVTMKVVGTNFTTNAVILWNGNKLATSVIDATTLSGSIQGGSLAVPGTAQVQVQNSQTGQASQEVPISIISSSTVVPLPLAITTPAIPTGVVGASYSVSLAATGGAPAYTWALTSGNLPAGLTLAPSTGVISGIPTSSGTSNFTLTVTDSSSPVQAQSAVLSITVAPAPTSPAQLAISTSALSSGIDGSAYSQSLQATGGTPAYAWSITSGSLPAGLALTSGSGVISGTPTASGTFSFTATATDSSNPVQTKSATLSITIAPNALTITTSSLVSGTEGTAYSQVLHATGGTPSYAWSVTSGSLPAGLSLAAGSGVISGTPTKTGTFSFTATATDSSNPVQTKSATLSITVAPNALTITTSSLASGTEGAAYSQTLHASGGTPAYAWSITSGNLPAGLTLAAGSGIISGTPTASGSFSFTATATDSSNPVQTKSAILSITIASSALVITTSSLAFGTEGAAYSQTLHASGGTPAYTWSIQTGSLPKGLTLASGSGVISGTPTTSGTFSFTASATDASNPVQTKSAALTITIAPNALTLATSSLASATEGAVYLQSLAATGGTPNYTWSITSGSLPAGLTLTASQGVISGTPAASGTSTFTITVRDSSSPVQTKSVALSITVTPPTLSVVTSSLAAGTEGAAYSATLKAQGGTPAYIWSITSGSLPAGLGLAASDGVISGTPTASGAFTFTVSVTDSSSPVQTKSTTLSLTVAGPALTITSSTLAAATVNTAYTQTLAASGGSLPYTWSISSGSLPAGLTLSSGGVISGTPTSSGTYKITVAVTDSSKPAQTQSAATDIIVATEPSNGAGTTWFIRPDGGTRYSVNVPTGQCNGLYDQPYPGKGVDQNCAYNDVRYMWSDNSGSAPAWVMSGGDTVVVRGCTALGSQTNASNPDCRLGYDNATNGNAPNYWCGYGNPNNTCFNPPIPSGTAAQPTRILGGCAYGTYSCTPIDNHYPYGYTNETQLFGGFGLTWTFNLESTKYVTIEGIELTTHNGVCTLSTGTPAYPRGCSSSVPYDDYAQNGFLTNNASSNIVFQDVYVHGFNAAGLMGPIGGPITMTRMFVGFNAFAGWNFDDGTGTPDAAGSAITASYVTMIFNGCYEQYPITAAFPAQVCYDTNSGGFGDSWSGQGSGGQNSVLSSFTCDHCVDDYNTKDGFIGPHIDMGKLSITNSVAIGNMGSNWKWGGDDSVVNTTTFENNLTVNNCTRMSEPMAGVPTTYNKYLTGFCRAGGNGIASIIPIGSTWNLTNNTFISAQQIAIYVACNSADTICPATINSTNNVFLGYTDPNNPYGDTVPTLYYLGSGIVLNASHNNEFGMKLGTCPSTANGMLCSDPSLLNEPSQTWTSEAALDVFDPFLAGNSFYPSSGSLLRGAGIQIPSLTTDYYDMTRPASPAMGSVEYAPAP
jgi:hypothetical protein